MEELNDLVEKAQAAKRRSAYVNYVSANDIIAISEAFRALEHELKDAKVCFEAAKQEIADLELKPRQTVGRSADHKALLSEGSQLLAAKMAELVPEEMPRYLLDEVEWRSEKKDGLSCYHMENLQRTWGKFHAAILCKIEEAK